MLKQQSSITTYGEQMSSSETMCTSVGKVQYVDNQKCMEPIEKLGFGARYSKPMNVVVFSSPKLYENKATNTNKYEMKGAAVKAKK